MPGNSTTINVFGHLLEVRLIDPSEQSSPTLVFLHEGLGSVSLWRDFPDRLAKAAGAAAVVYSRHGHGQSSILEEKRRPDYMHREALDVLPALLRELSIRESILFGHSDGASIAAIYAGAGHPVAGLVLEAPHVFVEEISLRGITQAGFNYRTADLPARLARHHRDADKTFWGWHDIWTHPSFRDWNIESSLPSITCPTLLIQGDRDEYGSIAQIDAVAAAVKGPAGKHLLPDCGHAPHRDQPDLTLKLVTLFLSQLPSQRPVLPDRQSPGVRDIS